MCRVMETVDDTPIVLILFEFLHCQQGTLLIGERKGLGCVHLFLRASHRTLIAVIRSQSTNHFIVIDKRAVV